MRTTAGPPRRVRDVVAPVARARSAVGAAAVREGGNRRARAVAAGVLIAARAIDALDGDLGSMLTSALTLHRDLAQAGRQSLASPGVAVPVALGTIGSVPVTGAAILTVLVDGIPRATVEVTLAVEFSVADLQVEICDGWLTAVACRQTVTAGLTVDTVRIGTGPSLTVDRTIAEGSRATGWASVPLPAPLPLAGAAAW